MTWEDKLLMALWGVAVAAVLFGPALVIGILLATGWRLG